jgi:hypothetical protein
MERSTMIAAHSAHVQSGVLAIQSMDLTKVLEKIQKPQPRGQGWTPEEAATADKWYRRFLTIAVKNPNEVLVPNEQVDELWHAHVLAMRKYEADTTRIFGSVLYHEPTFGETDLRPQFARTNALLRAEFGEDLNSSGDYQPTSCCCAPFSEATN